jgi:hypothetical protein
VRSSYNQARSARSWRRARLRDCSGSSACRWISASVCSPHALSGLVAGLAPQPHDPRAEQQGPAHDCGEDRHADLADGPERVVRPEEQSEPGDQHDRPEQQPDPHAHAAPQRVDRVAGQTGAKFAPAGPVPLVHPGPHDGQARGRNRTGPDDVVGEEGQRPPDQQEHAQRDAADGQRQLDAAAGVEGGGLGLVSRLCLGPGVGGGLVLVGQHDPGDDVDEHADAVGQHHDAGGEPDDDRLDAHPPGHTRAHAADDALVTAADELIGTRSGGHLPVIIARTR